MPRTIIVAVVDILDCSIEEADSDFDDLAELVSRHKNARLRRAVVGDIVGFTPHDYELTPEGCEKVIPGLELPSQPLSGQASRLGELKKRLSDRQVAYNALGSSGAGEDLVNEIASLRKAIAEAEAATNSDKTGNLVAAFVGMSNKPD